MHARISEADEPVQQVLIYAGTLNYLNTTAAEMLCNLQKQRKQQGITPSFAQVRDSVKDIMVLTGLVDAVGYDHFYNSAQEGVKAFMKASSQTIKQFIRHNLCQGLIAKFDIDMIHYYYKNREVEN